MGRRKRYGLHDDPNQMILPLFVALDFDESRKEAVAPSVIEDIRHEQPDYDDWSEDELVNLHINLLEQSLTQALSPRSGRLARMDVVDWISRITKRGTKEPPFSFAVCCRLSGYDPDELRDTFLEEIKFRGIDPYENKDV